MFKCQQELSSESFLLLYPSLLSIFLVLLAGLVIEKIYKEVFQSCLSNEKTFNYLKKKRLK